MIWVVSSALWIGELAGLNENRRLESQRGAMLWLAVPHQNDAAHLDNDLPTHGIVAVFSQRPASVGVW
jgi:hypothetical protein